jgi:hypothetical protein
MAEKKDEPDGSAIRWWDDMPDHSLGKTGAKQRPVLDSRPDEDEIRALRSALEHQRQITAVEKRRADLLETRLGISWRVTMSGRRIDNDNSR